VACPRSLSLIFFGGACAESGGKPPFPTCDPALDILSGCDDKLKFVGQSRAIIQFKTVEAEV